MIDPRDKLRQNINKRLRDNGINGFEGGKVVNICVDEAYKLIVDKRTVRQNAFLWHKPYKIVGDYLGYYPYEVHKLFTEMFLPKHCRNLDGTIDIIGGSTKSLTKKDFKEYWEKIQIFAMQEWELYIPNPNEELMISAELDAQQNK